ncbi:MAG TPA: hypothetical protein CFH81_00325 [Sulfurovum sp. UBA12169]|nr:MAG TPA: hypothetical protein CFH81_00325 [Sulfurovum sp. UBA12169]
MMNDIFESGELPTMEVYEAAHSVVFDYMEKKRCKIDVVAADLGTTKNVLYRQLNPDDTLMPLSIDRCIAITRLTGDMRILEAFAKVFDMVAVKRKTAEADIKDINLLVDRANMENSDVFRVIKNAIEDGAIDGKEREKILKEIDEAQVANAKLKDTVLHIAVRDLD